jgi:hypothetical protein
VSVETTTTAWMKRPDGWINLQNLSGPPSRVGAPRFSHRAYHGTPPQPPPDPIVPSDAPIRRQSDGQHQTGLGLITKTCRFFDTETDGKSSFYNLQLSCWFDFQPRCTKSEIVQPPTIKTIWISTLSLFQGGFSFFLSLQL